MLSLIARAIKKSTGLKLKKKVPLKSACQIRIKERVLIILSKKEILEKWRARVFTIKKKAQGNSLLLRAFFSDKKIIVFYNRIIRFLIEWSRAVSNFSLSQKLAYLFRKSCAQTLAIKHKKTVSWVYKKFGREISIVNFFLVRKNLVLNSKERGLTNFFFFKALF
jgi:hypothetical protein